MLNEKQFFHKYQKIIKFAFYIIVSFLIFSNIFLSLFYYKKHREKHFKIDDYLIYLNNKKEFLLNKENEIVIRNKNGNLLTYLTNDTIQKFNSFIKSCKEDLLIKNIHY